MLKPQIIKGFSKLSKDKKLSLVASYFEDPKQAEHLLKSFWHGEPDKQNLFDEFSENTLTNYFFPYGIAPNFMINGKMFMLPMVVEESSVVAAAANSAKFWAEYGGFQAEIISTTKIGQVHFIWDKPMRMLSIISLHAQCKSPCSLSIWTTLKLPITSTVNLYIGCEIQSPEK